ncbi:MAG: response regulator [Blastocatellia bacterium]
MKEQHIALIVEDDKETAEDLVEILSSLDCGTVVADNREDALVELQNRSFCLILLDLQIKKAGDSIKGHVEYGKALLRNIREKQHDHNGTTFWLPVLIVSGFARELDEAVDVMKDGASDVIHKPLQSRQVSQRIRQALENSGRQMHKRCHEPPQTQSPNLKDGIVIGIPGERIGRRTCVTIGTKTVELPNSILKVLLHLMVAQQKGEPVNKRDMGATEDQGFKGISTLRYELKPILGSFDIIKNHYHGDYSFDASVKIGDCAVDKLIEIGDQTISNLAKLLQSQSPGAAQKSEGNSEDFPTHRRRRQK